MMKENEIGDDMMSEEAYKLLNAFEMIEKTQFMLDMHDEGDFSHSQHIEIRQRSINSMNKALAKYGLIVQPLVSGEDSIKVNENEESKQSVAGSRLRPYPAPSAKVLKRVGPKLVKTRRSLGSLKKSDNSLQTKESKPQNVKRTAGSPAKKRTTP